MLIRVTNVDAYALRLTPLEREWLSKFLVVHTTGKMGRQKEVPLLNFDGSFPSGFVGFIRDQHKAMREDPQAPAWVRESTLRFMDERERVGTIVDADTSWLRDYQAEAVEAVLKVARGVVKAPTSAGKTELIIALAMRVQGIRWLVITPRTQLARDGANRFLLRKVEQEHRAGLIDDRELAQAREKIDAGKVRNKLAERRVGFVGDSVWDVEPDDTIVFATFQSLTTMSERAVLLLESAGGVMIDEAHVSGAATYAAVLRIAANAFWRVAFSATPLNRTDGKNALVIGATGRVLYEIKVPTLIAAGVFARPRLLFYQHDCAPDLPGDDTCKACDGKGEEFDPIFACDVECSKCKGRGSTRPSYASVVDLAVCKSKARNELIVELAVTIATTPCLIFVSRTSHAKKLRKMLEAELGTSVQLVNQDSSESQRNEAVRAIKSGEAAYTIASKVWQEGVDAPSIATVINASGGKSAIKILQQLGRGARTAKGKGGFTYIDVMDVGDRTLSKHARARKALLEQEIGLPVTTRSLRQQNLVLRA